ncbi:hypothetical protein QBC34DRAFT_313785, partial [Podospora aff. communis PSN243]
YHAYTIWLFTYSSLKDTVYPSAAFATSTALSTSFPFPAPSGYLSVLASIFFSLFWAWLFLLFFSLHNQHQESSVLEDAINKPWRPIPSGRITSSQTRLLLAAYYPIWFGISFYFGCSRQCLGLTVTTWYYCELGGCEQGGFARNLLNTMGYSGFFAGALQSFLFAQQSFVTMTGMPNPEMPDVYAGKSGVWLVMVCALIFSTIHAQDFRDEEGDRARGRRTVQTTLGDKAARWAVVIAAVGWSIVIPWALGLGLVVMGWLLAGAGMLAWCMLRCLLGEERTVERDVAAYKVWIGWFVAVILAPLMGDGLEKAMEVLKRQLGYMDR